MHEDLISIRQLARRKLLKAKIFGGKFKNRKVCICILQWSLSTSLPTVLNYSINLSSFPVCSARFCCPVTILRTTFHEPIFLTSCLSNISFLPLLCMDCQAVSCPYLNMCFPYDFLFYSSIWKIVFTFFLPRHCLKCSTCIFCGGGPENSFLESANLKNPRILGCIPL